MTKWKLCRQIFGSEEFTFSDGDKVTIGRGINNVISLPSAIVSRKHCVIEVQTHNALITDLQSSNGVYVGTIKVPPNKPYVIADSDIIGIGWSEGAPLVNIDDAEKYVFKFKKEKCKLSLANRIQYQSDNEVNDIKAEIAKLNGDSSPNSPSGIIITEAPVSPKHYSLKRKINDTKVKEDLQNEGDEVINISDSDSDINAKELETSVKKLKLEAFENPQKELVIENKNENELGEYDAFSVKQELSGYDDEAINIDSESDSESEQWLLRLSQNSPGKPFIKVVKPKMEIKPEDCSYSQLDDDFISSSLVFESEEEFEDDIIYIPPEKSEDVLDTSKLPENMPPQVNLEKDATDNNVIANMTNKSTESPPHRENTNRHENDNLLQKEQYVKSPQNELYKKVQMIEPLVHLPKEKSRRSTMKTKQNNHISKHSNNFKISHSKHTSYRDEHKKKSLAKKEERKKKLKELATKDKDIVTKTNKDPTSSSKPVTNIKVTSSNRGAFLSDTTQEIQKTKTSVNKSKDRHSSSKLKEKKSNNITENMENQPKDSKKSDKEQSDKHLSKHKSNTKEEAKKETVPLKSLKPLNYGEDALSGNPISKEVPKQTGKIKKKVCFSEKPPEVQVFAIEPGNRMKKTSLVKTTLVDVRQTPVFSLEKITLMKILRWNPQWLEEQLNNNDPPPILGHNNTPMTLFHSFVNHNQYVQFVGDLLLMEIWECLTIAHTKTPNQNYIKMIVESPLPVPSQERCFDLLSLSVSVSVHPSEIKKLPRFGEIMLITFGSENAKTERFFYVHNVKQLPSVPGQVKFNIALYASTTEKVMSLKPGTIVLGRSLAYINKELMLFEAMEYLGGSPLRDAILHPKPHNFINSHLIQVNCKSQWTTTLNPSQLKAVNFSVAAALSDKPSIQMIQGPPGTGKSSVICAIVMTYFYDAKGKKQQNRGKILICATSNAAVDGLVIRLLNLRQSLPKPERFRMVRVGREEAMHPVAANVCSQQLAQRDIARINEQPTAIAGLNEEILHLEAKINMWKTAVLDAKDPQRVAYCQGRVTDLVKRINLLRSGSGACGRRGSDGEEMRLAGAERRIIEHADIVVTTLASAQNHKMKGLKRRIALCIIDEAGQVIEPETLIPLTLDVTRLTLIGDPQQLPGFICSQRAKKHGLGESLFSRLTSCTDVWTENNPVVLLDQQYRMHPDIADYPSRAFYGGMIQTVPPIRPNNIRLPPYCIISISSGDKGQGISGANEMEAWGVTRLVMALDLMLRPLNLNLAVITPYSAHKELIKKHLKTLHKQTENQVEVNTVDSFQGQERDVVVVSLARSNGVGFLTDAGRMNVMLTRAKHALLICLNPFALMKNQQWRTLIEDAQRRDLYTNLPKNMCQPITAEQVANDRILKYVINK